MRTLDWVILGWIVTLQVAYVVLAWQQYRTVKLLDRLIDVLGKLKVP